MARFKGIFGALLMATAVNAAAAPQQEIKIGVVASLTGVFQVGGLQMQNAINAYVKEHGDVVAGKKITLIYRDSGGPNPEVAKRLAQELVSRDKVDFLAGFDFTPSALAAASVATQAKKPMVVMNAATSSITTKSPFIVRTSFTLPQTSLPMGHWAAKQGFKKVYTLVADFAPGHDAEEWFKKGFTEKGGQIVGEVRVPVQNPDFAPYIQRIKDAKPDAVFAFMPVGEPVIAFFKAFQERGLAQAGIKLLAPEGWVDGDVLNAAGQASLGSISAGFYTPSHDSAKNKSFIKAFNAVAGGKMEPNYLAVGAYDGMAVIYEAIKKVNGAVEDGEKVVNAMKGLNLESPRGPLKIDAETRDVINTVYVRRVENVGGHMVAVEFDKFNDVKDPAKAK